MKTNTTRGTNVPKQETVPPMPNERKTIMMLALADTIMREISRMCVTKELSELDTMHAHAKKNLDKLSKMIYDNRFKAESEGE